MQRPAAATLKAKELVRMAVAKVKSNERLYPQYVDVVKSALVIGGGVAGMTAALELAGQGFEVHLVEKDPELGGLARKIRFSPDGDVAAKLNTLVNEVRSNSLIHLYLNSEIKSIEGSLPRFESVIQSAGEEHAVKHGVIIVATGAREFKPQEYLYGQNQKVLTQTEFEEKLAGNNLGGSDIVMIQCVGSREDPRDYCSRVCCSKAIKNALKMKELNPQANIYILHKDIRTYGFNEQSYRQAREQGVIFIRYDDVKPVVSAQNGKLKVTVKDQLLDMNLDLSADHVVLSAAVEAHESNQQLAQLLKVPLNKHGFFLEAHMKLRPVDFATDGIFVCGTAHSPKNVPESIVQAMAASTRAGVVLSQDQMEIEPRISEPIDANCDGCAFCVEPCPYQAITLIEYMRNGNVKKTVDVDITLCHGCGACMATCPKQGIMVRNFKLSQFDEVIESALQPTV
jgi:heterodisulfide reductase subunit A